MLIKQMEGQLLRSDLADSTMHHAGLLPDEEGETCTLFVADGSSRNKNAAAVLVQILEVLEIGRPALELLDIHKNRVEDKKVLREQGRQVRRAVAHVEHDEAGAGTGNPAGAQQQQANANQDEPANTIGVKGFPRAMLRLRVSDGFTEYVAIENKRVHALSLEDTMLGSKVGSRPARQWSSSNASLPSTAPYQEHPLPEGHPHAGRADLRIQRRSHCGAGEG